MTLADVHLVLVLVTTALVALTVVLARLAHHLHSEGPPRARPDADARHDRAP